MNREEIGFAAAVVGSGLVAAGVLNVTAAWVFVAGGLLVAVAGILCLGTPGSVPTVLTGAWISLSVLLPWAQAQWNLFLAGILAISLGFWVGAVAAKEPLYEEE